MLSPRYLARGPRLCTAHRCTTPIPRDHFFCSLHWGSLNALARARILKAYAEGAGARLTTILYDCRRTLAARELVG